MYGLNGKTEVDKNAKQFLVTVECEDCKRKFQIYTGMTSNESDKAKVCRKEFSVNNGKSIFLTYYDCPSCGRRHYVQIDDEVSTDKLKEVSMMFIKLSAKKRKGKEISKKQSDEFKKARQHLSDYRIKLMEEYTGKLIRNNETESNFVLRFSV